MDIGNLRWRKSSRSSSNQGACVEVARLASGHIAIRDSKNPTQTPVVINPHEFAAFLRSVKTTEL